MRTTRLNAEVIALFDRRKRLLAELNEVEAQLRKKHYVLINEREVETTAINVQRVAERRVQPCD